MRYLRFLAQLDLSFISVTRSEVGICLTSCRHIVPIFRMPRFRSFQEPNSNPPSLLRTAFTFRLGVLSVNPTLAVLEPTFDAVLDRFVQEERLPSNQEGPSRQDNVDLIL
jgi:hypothetical protein